MIRKSGVLLRNFSFKWGKNVPHFLEIGLEILKGCVIIEQSGQIPENKGKQRWRKPEGKLNF